MLYSPSDSCVYVENVTNLDTFKLLDSSNVILSGQSWSNNFRQTQINLLTTFNFLSEPPFPKETYIPIINISACFIPNVRASSKLIVIGFSSKDNNNRNIILPNFVTIKNNKNRKHLSSAINKYYTKQNRIRDNRLNPALELLLLSRTDKINSNNNGKSNKRLNKIINLLDNFIKSPSFSNNKDDYMFENCKEGNCYIKKTGKNLKNKIGHSSYSKLENTDRLNILMQKNRSHNNEAQNNIHMKEQNAFEYSLYNDNNKEESGKISEISGINASELNTNKINKKLLRKNKRQKNNNTAFSANNDSKKIRKNVKNYFKQSLNFDMANESLFNISLDPSNKSKEEFDNLKREKSILDQDLMKNVKDVDPLNSLDINFDRPENFINIDKFRKQDNSKFNAPQADDNNEDRTANSFDFTYYKNKKHRYDLHNEEEPLYDNKNDIPEKLKIENMRKYFSTALDNFTIAYPQFIDLNSSISSSK